MANNDPFGRREREEGDEEERGGGGGERRREECAGGEACAECVRAWESGRGNGDSLREGGGFRKTMRSRRGGEGGGDRVRNPSRGRRKESPLGGRGWGEAQKKCTLEILEISLKEGEKEESIVGKGCGLVFSG